MTGLRSLMPPGLRAGRRIGDRPQVLHSRAGPPGSSFPNNIGYPHRRGAAPLCAGRRLAALPAECRLAWILGGGYEEPVLVSGT
jgi:hypothetical protein